MTLPFLEGVADVLDPLRCGDGILSVIPSLVFAFCMSMLFYRTLLSGRTRFLRVFSRDMLLQEVLFIWLINVSLKAWIYYLDVLDFLLDVYRHQLQEWKSSPSGTYLDRLPYMLHNLFTHPFRLLEWLSSPTGGNLHRLPLLMDFLLNPHTLKIIICSVTCLAPLLVMNKITRHMEHPLAHLMMWLGMNRWERSELGLARYFIQRVDPVLVDALPTPPTPPPLAAVVNSTGTLPPKISVSIDGYMLQASRRQRPRFRHRRSRVRSSKSAA